MTITNVRQGPPILTKKPVYLMSESDLHPLVIKKGLEGINEVIAITKHPSLLSLKNFGTWRNDGWKIGNSLTKYNSVDWYIAFAQDNSRKANQISSTHLQYALHNEPWQKNEQHYDIVFLKADIGDNDPNLNFMCGFAVPRHMAIASTARFTELALEEQAECFKTLVIHEVGHMFGLPGDRRTSHVTHSLGKHCTNRKCVMRQGLTVPHDWINLTNDRLSVNTPFCTECLSEFPKFF